MPDNGKTHSKLYLGSFRAAKAVKDQLFSLKVKAKSLMNRGTVPAEPDYAAFERIVDLIPDLAGYRESAVKRLKDRAVSKGFEGLSEYYAFLLEHDDELADLKENLTFVGSHFFRGDVWPEFRRCIRTTLAARGGGESLRVWCAGCSSGKEAYSMLLTLLDYLPAEKIDLLASDYNDEMLQKCEEGVYPLSTLFEIPERYRCHALQYSDVSPSDNRRVLQTPKFQFDEHLRSMVKTSHVNLLTDDYPRGFDVVSCRNVIKFFNDETVVQVQRKLSDTLVPGGILVVSEDAHEQIEDPDSLGLERVGESCIYRKLA